MIKFKQDFEIILKEQNALLDKMIDEQNKMRLSIVEKNWEDLSKSIANLNYMSEEFKILDSEREIVQEMMKYEEIKNFFDELALLRKKLTKYKIENQAISKYVSTLKDFIKGVVDNALPQSRNKVYTKTGLYQPQPQSVVINTLF